MTTAYGVGIGWRPEIGGFVAQLPGLRFAEVVAESVHAHGPLPAGLGELRERGVTVVPHGVKLSLGGAEPVEPARVAHLAAVAERLGAPLVSEHIAFVRAGGLGWLSPAQRQPHAVGDHRQPAGAQLGQRRWQGLLGRQGLGHHLHEPQIGPCGDEAGQLRAPPDPQPKPESGIGRAPITHHNRLRRSHRHRSPRRSPRRRVPRSPGTWRRTP